MSPKCQKGGELRTLCLSDLPPRSPNSPAKFRVSRICLLFPNIDSGRDAVSADFAGTLLLYRRVFPRGAVSRTFRDLSDYIKYPSGTSMTDPGTEIASHLAQNDKELRDMFRCLFLDGMTLRRFFSKRRWCCGRNSESTTVTVLFFPGRSVLQILKSSICGSIELVGGFCTATMYFMLWQRLKLGDELKERQAAMKNCLAKLNVDDRSLLERRYSDSSSVKSLAQESGRTVKALYRRLDRIRDIISLCISRTIASDEQ